MAWSTLLLPESFEGYLRPGLLSAPNWQGYAGWLWSDQGRKFVVPLVEAITPRLFDWPLADQISDDVEDEALVGAILIPTAKVGVFQSGDQFRYSSIASLAEGRQYPRPIQPMNPFRALLVEVARSAVAAASTSRFAV